MSGRKSAKRDDIICAAVSLFQQYGYLETSMDRIAEEAQVSKRTVYNHFESKDALFEAIREELVNRCGHLQLPEPTGEALHEQLKQVGRLYAELMTSDDFIKLTRVVLSRFIQSPQMVGAAVTGREPQMPIQRWFEQAQTKGLMPAFDAEQATAKFTGMITATEFWPRLIQDEQPRPAEERDRYLESVVGMFLKHYAPQAA